MSLKQQLSDERKHLQAIGHLPKWYTTDGWSLFKQKYAVAGEEAFLGRAKTIAETLSNHTKNKSYWKDVFFNMIWNGWVSCSTPLLSNCGTNKGLIVSCSGQYVGDGIHEFYSNLHEGAMLSKNGFGTSSYLGDIRKRGSKISTGGTAQGILPVFQDFVTMASKVSQGGTRRGSWAGYLPISHGDFQEVYDFVYDLPDEVNIGFNWYDSDTLAMDSNDAETDKRFKKLLKLRMVQGKGYIFFPDKANRLAPQMYKDRGFTVHSSNLCLTGDTEIEICRGPEGKYAFKIRLDNFVEMWNLGYFREDDTFVKSYKDGKAIWSKVTAAAKTATVNKLIKITTPCGKIIKCTPEHQIFTSNRGWVMAKDLIETDELVIE